jgi:hypothetical protein
MRLKLFGGLLLASIAWLRAQPTTIINDTFADGERVTQNLPSSVAWYTVNAARLNLAVRNGALTLVGNNNDRDVWGYFPTITLGIGDSLTFTVDFRWTNNPPVQSTPAFKIALCYSNGLAPRRADGAIPIGPYQGYANFTNPADASAGTNIRKRDGPAASLPASLLLEQTDGADNITVWNSLRAGLAGTQQANTPYTAVLKVTRTGADTANITTSITGGTLSPNNTIVATDTSNIVFNFDTVAIDAADSAAYGDLLVTRAQLVQEVNSARLVNLSILTTLPASGDSFTLGYVVGGSGTAGAKPLVIRAVGPSLGALGVPGTLDDPKLELFAGNTKIDENDNWGGGTSLAAAMAAVGAFPYASATSRDAAALSSLNAGASNTMKVSAAGNGTGTVLAEIYDAEATAPYSASTPRLINLSVLKNLGTGLTVGFVVGGSGTKTVLVRAIGPTLGAAPFGIPGTVADPQLTLLQGSTQIVTNDNWGGTAPLSAAFKQVGAFDLPANSRDAAVLTTLAPGNYTVQVSGVGGTTGIALVEVYEVQ